MKSIIDRGLSNFMLEKVMNGTTEIDNEIYKKMVFIVVLIENSVANDNNFLPILAKILNETTSYARFM